MAIDLKKVLAISGQPGLFEYIAQARNGFIVEAMETKKRSSVPTSAKVTTLADVSIYADDGEVTLRKVLEDMRAALDGKEAPGSKSDLIVEYFIENGVYDVYTIDTALFEHDLPMLSNY